jgi:hypothetical protein
MKTEEELRTAKYCIEELLYRCRTNDNGYYDTYFGPYLCGQMLKLTGFDMSKREIHEKS